MSDTRSAAIEQPSAALEARVEAILARYRPQVIAGMRIAVDGAAVEHMRYVRYHLGWQDASGSAVDGAAGKMLRPAVTMLCCEAAGGEGAGALPAAARALPAAVAIELLHNFSLIHDDIEDRSEKRHGRPTLWTVAGIEQAINAGDGLFALAQRTLLELSAAGLEDGRVLAAARTLSDACIALCEGQYADLGFEARSSVTLAEYEAMIGGKTAALVGAAAAIGAICAGASEAAVAAFDRWGTLAGLAFQVTDDALGIWGDPAVTGKPAADDILRRKKSFPVAYAAQHLPEAPRAELLDWYARADQPREQDVARMVGLIERSGAREAAVAAAEGHIAAAEAAVAGLDLQPDRHDDLRDLAAYFVTRAR